MNREGEPNASRLDWSPATKVETTGGKPFWEIAMGNPENKHEARFTLTTSPDGEHADGLFVGTFHRHSAFGRQLNRKELYELIPLILDVMKKENYKKLYFHTLGIGVEKLADVLGAANVKGERTDWGERGGTYLRVVTDEQLESAYNEFLEKRVR